MSNSTSGPNPVPQQEPEPKGPNLFVLYGLLVLALLVAMAFAAMVVWPFHLRH